MNTLSKTAFYHALALVIYIALVGSIMSHGNTLFGKADTFLTPIAVLSLFTLSATVVGALVLGKPLMMYIDNQKKEAVSLFLQIVGWLAGCTLILLMTMLLMNGN